MAATMTLTKSIHHYLYVGGQHLPVAATTNNSFVLKALVAIVILTASVSGNWVAEGAAASSLSSTSTGNSYPPKKPSGGTTGTGLSITSIGIGLTQLRHKLREEGEVYENDLLHCSNPTTLSIHDVAVICNNETFLWDLDAFDPELPPEYCSVYGPLSDLTIDMIVSEEMEPCFLWYSVYGDQQQQQQQLELEVIQGPLLVGEEPSQDQQVELSLTTSPPYLDYETVYPTDNVTDAHYLLTPVQVAAAHTVEPTSFSSSTLQVQQGTNPSEGSQEAVTLVMTAPPEPQRYPSVVTQDFAMLLITYLVDTATRRRRLFNFDRNRLSEITAQHLLTELQVFLGRGSVVGLDLVMTSVQARALKNQTIVATEAISGRVLVTSPTMDLDSVVERSFEADALQRYIELISTIPDTVSQRISNVYMGQPPDFSNANYAEGSSYVAVFGWHVNNIHVIAIGCGIIAAVMIAAVCIFCFIRRERRRDREKDEAKEKLEAKMGSSEAHQESIYEAQPSEAVSTLDGDQGQYAQSEVTSVYSYIDSNLGGDYSIAPSLMYGNDMSVVDDESLPSTQSRAAMWSIMDGIDMNDISSPAHILAVSPSVQSVDSTNIISPSNMLVTTEKRENPRRQRDLIVFSDDDEESLNNSCIMGSKLWNRVSPRDIDPPISVIASSLDITEIPEEEYCFNAKNNVDSDGSRNNKNQEASNSENTKTSMRDGKPQNVSYNVLSDAILSSELAQRARRNDLSVSTGYGLSKGPSSRNRVPFEKLWGKDNEKMVASIKSARRNPLHRSQFSNSAADAVRAAPSDELESGSVLKSTNGYDECSSENEDANENGIVLKDKRTVLGDRKNLLALSTTNIQKHSNLRNNSMSQSTIETQKHASLSSHSGVWKRQNNPYCNSGSTFVDENNATIEGSSPLSVLTLGSDNPYIENSSYAGNST